MNSLRHLVRKKYRNSEKISAWWIKHAAVRRRRVWKLSEQQNHRCCYCARLTWMFDQQEIGQEFQIDKLPGMVKGQMATADHFIPSGQGGSQSLNNLVMACVRCNNLRGDMPAIDFWEAMQDPKKLRAMIAQRSRLIQKNKNEKDTKRAPIRHGFVVQLSILIFCSPVARAIFDEAMIEVDRWVGHRYNEWTNA